MSPWRCACGIALVALINLGAVAMDEVLPPVETALEPETNEQRHPLVDHLMATSDAAHADRVVVADLEFEDVAGKLQLRDGKLLLHDLEGRAYGGRAHGQFSIDLHDGSMHIKLRVENLRLEEFLLRFGGVEDAPSGRISGDIDLHLPQGVANLMHGELKLSLRDGDIVSVGMITDILVGSPLSSRGNDRAEAHIRIENRHAIMQDFTITSPSVRLIGQGTVAFDGSTDIIMSPHTTPGYLKMVPLLGDVISWTLGQASGTLGRFRISGHISNPQFTNRPF